ncbi:hypothetical protein EZV62_004645 [Acer yangbiense]|uniref:Rho GDP-dissociation inhibitor 1 n=1 Tax=Acer yangbiense TaxID=1000413 RepID=A0A5C7IKM8_9ROSI|nr:hypothetical protein EZV62_004645 [Acer yangbiense]
MGFDEKKNNESGGTSGETIIKTPPNEENVEESTNGGRISRQTSENSICATEDEEDDEDRKIELETLDPEVKIMSLAIKSAGRPDIILPVPENGNPKGSWFTLKEGSRYSLEFTFQVSNNIVSGLRYTNTVWKTGVKVDSTKKMLGTFSPQAEPYTHEIPEETTPSGMFARGSYSARSKFHDDDNKCYLEINYTFDIRKEWQST